MNYTKNANLLTNLFDNLQERGPYGDPKYRGNASGTPFLRLAEFFGAKKGADFMVGGGTSKDVFDALGIQYIVRDLNPKWGGFDLVNDDIEESADFIIFHPPYNRKDGGIIRYSGNIWGNKPNPSDLSHMSWPDYLKALNICISKQYLALRNGGRMAMLIGDCREKGKLYSAFLDCIKPGEVEHIMIKKQENCWSDKNSYSGKFIPIVTEFLIIFKKTHHYLIDGRQTVFFEKDIRQSANASWRDIVYSAMEDLGGKAKLDDLYSEISSHAKTKNNSHWQAKVRQILQTCKDFTHINRGYWGFTNSCDMVA